MDVSLIKKYFSLNYAKKVALKGLLFLCVAVLGYIIMWTYSILVGIAIILAGAAAFIINKKREVKDNDIDSAVGLSKDSSNNGKFIIQNYLLSSDAPFVVGKDRKIRTPVYIRSSFDFDHKEELHILVTKVDLFNNTKTEEKFIFYFESIKYKRKVVSVDNEYGKASMLYFIVSDSNEKVVLPAEMNDYSVERIIEMIRKL